MNKQELRNSIRNMKRQFSKQQLGELSLLSISKLRKNQHLQSAHKLLLYYSLPDEVNTHAFIDELVDMGKEVYLPEVINESEMLIRKYTGKHDLKEGCFHIMEPIGEILPIERYQEIEVGIIPGMAFDKKGNRLGRGKGYYDRTLTQMPHIYKIGICFDFQKVEDIPTEKTDIKMDAIV